jgi:hypothetical protein
MEIVRQKVCDFVDLITLSSLVLFFDLCNSFAFFTTCYTCLISI